MVLALNVGLTGLALRIKRIEVLFLGPPRRTYAYRWRSGPHAWTGQASRWPLSAKGFGRRFRPKKRGPYQCVPVISRAIDDSER